MNATSNNQPDIPLVYRTATLADGHELARLRWIFSSAEAQQAEPLEAFIPNFLTGFLRPALESGLWAVFVVEQKPGRLIGNIYLQIIRKIPRPARRRNTYGYITNVFIEPEWRNGGVGGVLLEQVISWARERDLEFLVLWPSELSVEFYKRHGFSQGGEAMELHFDE